jgi:magnesium-dependent phosphatase 1
MALPAVMPALMPALIVFDLDACLWEPEMFQISRPTGYDAKRGGVVAGRDTVRLFPGAAAVLRRFLPGVDPALAAVRVAVASSTTEPGYARICLGALLVDPSRGETVEDIVDYQQVYPGSKGRAHFPALRAQAGVPFEQMLFFDDCTYGDNCAEVAACCPGVACVRTPEGLTEGLFEAGLAAFARGERSVLKIG